MLRETATPVLMLPKPATWTTAAKSSVLPTLPPATGKTPTRVKPAVRSAATKHWGCSWTVFRPSSATGCSSAPARLRVVLKGEGRQLCPTAPITIRRNPTVWSYVGSAARIPCAGKIKGKLGEFGVLTWLWSVVSGRIIVYVHACLGVWAHFCLVLCDWNELPNTRRFIIIFLYSWKMRKKKIASVHWREFMFDGNFFAPLAS